MEKKYEDYGGLCLLYGILFAVCMYDNFCGITYPIFTGITIGVSYLLLKESGIQIKKYSWIYAGGMMLLGISTTLTTSWVLIFFNTIGIFLLFLTGMIHQFYDNRNWDFVVYLRHLVLISLASLVHIFEPFTHGFRYLSGAKEGKRKNVMAVAAGVLIALLLLVIVFPMLLSSDMIFAGIFAGFLENLQLGTFFEIIVMILAGFVASYSFFASLSCKIKEKEEKRKYFDSLIGITFTGILAILYAMYAGIQILYLFLRVGGGLPAGVSYSEYARQGFFQLVFVGIVNFVLVLVCMKVFQKNKVLHGILTLISICTFVMIISAVYRMVLYIQVYHLTFLRVLVLWFLAVLALIMLGVIVSIYREQFPLFRYAAVVVGCGYLIFSFAKPDVWIARYNIEHVENITGEELEFLLYSLSDDAAPAIAKIDPKDVKPNEWMEYAEENWAEDEYNTYFERLQDEYESLSVRTWNLSKMQAYKAAKEVKNR